MKLTIIAFVEILPRDFALDDDVALRFQLTVKLADDLVSHCPATVKGFAYFFAVKKWFHARHPPVTSKTWVQYIPHNRNVCIPCRTHTYYNLCVLCNTAEPF